MRYTFFILILFIPLVGCEDFTASRPGSIKDGSDDIPMYKGYTIDGKLESCKKPNPDMACPEIWGAMQEFAKRCVDLGKKAYQCSCDKSLCSENIFDQPTDKVHKGYDMTGAYRTCPVPSPDMMCPAIFGPSDQFAQDCREAGYTSMQCGCSDHLCSVNLAAKTQVLSAIAGVDFKVSKNSMLGELYDISINTRRKIIFGKADHDGVLEEPPYILTKDTKTTMIADDGLWSHLSKSLDAIKYAKLSDADCTAITNISDHVIRKVTNLVSGKVYSDIYQRDPLNCFKFSDEFGYLQASMGAIFIKSGAKQESDKPRMCTEALVRMTHPDYKIEVVAINGCQAADLEAWGFKANNIK